MTTHRVLVLGPCGAGKSTFAVKLGATTGLPVIHLDKEFWQPGWVMPPAETWRERVRELVAGDRWIIEGTYAGTLPLRLPRADTVFYLDYPRPLFMANILRRVFTHYGTVRPDLAADCPEHLDWEFLRYAWNFNRDVRPGLFAALAGHEGVHVLKKPSLAFSASEIKKRGF